MKQRDFDRVVGKDKWKIRLDKYLVEAGLGVSRSEVQRLVECGQVLVDGKRVKSHHLLKGGERVTCTYELPEKLEVEPEDIPIDVVYEDHDVVVVDKPSGMVVHPVRGNLRSTLVNALLYHCRSLSDGSDLFRPGVIHRLDKDTTGLLVFAKTNLAKARLGRQMEERTITRKYITVCWGNMPQRSGTIDAPVGRHTFDRTKMAVTPLSSRNAVTRYRVIERFEIATHLELKLLTGRTHQIRVHLQHFGNPVVGDPTYGGRKRSALVDVVKKHLSKIDDMLALIDRQALHAAVLGFEHPKTGKHLEFSSPLPKDMKGLLDFLKTMRN
jgi:23S rRNA pseudouridine1911/1915/1917 synthase